MCCAMFAQVLKGKILKYPCTWTRFDRRFKCVISEMRDRNLIHDIFPGNAWHSIRESCGKIPQTFYAGFDPTADSLHIGHLLVLNGLIHLQRAGHQAIALVGGATSLIGDPSGRSVERSKLGAASVESNSEKITEQIKTIFKNHSQYFRGNEMQLRDIKIVNNVDWYQKMSLIEFISSIGRHLRMGSMLSRSSVHARLRSETGMSFSEFAYQLFQAYDWLHLFKDYDCRFQIGGSDQMGNIMSGQELISKLEKKNVFGLTVPLVTNEEGNKFGKSAGKAVWLDEHKTSILSFYQFFVRMPDNDVVKLLKLFTFLPMHEVHTIIKEHEVSPELRTAQKTLAKHCTMLVHGESGLKQAEAVSSALYEGSLEFLGNLDATIIQDTLSGCTICQMALDCDMTLLDLVMKAKCFMTESDAVRIIGAGGLYVNQKRMQNVSEIISPSIHILKNNLTLIRVGRKNYYIVKWLN